MSAAQRYLLFAIIDVLLAGFIFYRSIWPAIQGEVPVGLSTWFSVGLCLLLLVMSGRFAWLAKTRWD